MKKPTKKTRAQNTSRRLTKALEKNGLVAPKTKKDGTPFTPWSEEVALRLAKKEARIAANGGVEDRTGKCTAHTSGVHGPKRLCDRWAVNGLRVCPIHGGSTKAAKAAAQEFLTNELMPTMKRLRDIRDQDDHLPSALGAATHLANRILGKPDSTERDKGAGAPIIRIGMALGGLPGQNKLQVAVQVEPSRIDDSDDEISPISDDAAIEADYEVSE